MDCTCLAAITNPSYANWDTLSPAYARMVLRDYR
jgi:hypothetical protein